MVRLMESGFTYCFRIKETSLQNPSFAANRYDPGNNDSHSSENNNPNTIQFSSGQTGSFI